jgi:hypothetical protein
MDKIVIAGGKPLRGRIRISGAKNASLAVLCATFLSRNEIVLEGQKLNKAPLPAPPAGIQVVWTTTVAQQI